MSHSSPQGMKYNRSSLLSLENNHRHANGGAKLLTIRKLNSVYNKFKLSGDRIQTTVKRRCFIQERDFTNLISTTGSNGDAFISTEKEVAYFDPKIIIYNRVQKCGSRTILQAVRPILEFNNVAFEAKELKFYLTNEEQTQFRNDLGTVMT